MDIKEIADSIKDLQARKAAVERRISEAENILGQAVKTLTAINGALEYAQSIYNKEAEKEKVTAEKDKLTT